MKGVYKKIIDVEKDISGGKIDFKIFVKIILQQRVRFIFDCEGLKSFEAIKNKLHVTKWDSNYKNIKFKTGPNGIGKLFKNNDKINAEQIEWDKYLVCIRQIIHFHLEDKMRYDKIFVDNWNEQKDEQNEQKQEEKKGRNEGEYECSY